MCRIPIIIICYNNYKYVENTINQIININEDLGKDIIILDNKSTCEKTRNLLLYTKYKVILNVKNVGPWISCQENQNQQLYDLLPDKFIVTDPDLQFNPNLPSNFVEILAELSDKYKMNKVGFALDISDYNEKMFQTTYHINNTIYDHEIYWWKNKIENDTYELYNAGIDTTFTLINKKYPGPGRDIRVAGIFTAKHIPWYIDNWIYNLYDNYTMIKSYSNVSTSAKIVLDHINENYIKINKNDIYFFIKNTEEDPNLNFWKNIYEIWEKETFDVFDKFLKRDKVFIDIGAWIGPTTIYGCRKSKHVYSVEADCKSVVSLENNCRTNCDNYTVLNNAIYNADNIDIKFGKNLYLQNSKMNDSTSHIYLDGETSNELYYVKSIRIQSIIDNNNIPYDNISLIKVDIEGGEENILNDLFEVYSKHKIPMYISFHYSWWKDKNLDRFDFLSNTIKEYIIKNSFISILFT
jgi:FkbM family methyltransferase